MLTNIVRFIVRSVSKMSPGLPPRAIFETAGKYFYIRAYKQVNNIYGFKVPLMALCILHICNIFILMVTFVVYLVRPKIHLPELSCDQNWWFFPFWNSNRDEKNNSILTTEMTSNRTLREKQCLYLVNAKEVCILFILFFSNKMLRIHSYVLVNMCAVLNISKGHNILDLCLLCAFFVSTMIATMNPGTG